MSFPIRKGWLDRWGDTANSDDAHSRPVAEHLAHVWRDSLRDDDQGWWDDWVAILSPRGFDHSNIETNHHDDAYAWLARLAQSHR